MSLVRHIGGVVHATALLLGYGMILFAIMAAIAGAIE